MSDDFKRLNVPKQACPVCPPYRGENHNLRPLKPQARRRARHLLKSALRAIGDER